MTSRRFYLLNNIFNNLFVFQKNNNNYVNIYFYFFKNIIQFVFFHRNINNSFIFIKRKEKRKI